MNKWGTNQKWRRFVFNTGANISVSLQLREWLAIVCRKAHHFYSNYYRNMLETKAIIGKFLLTGWRT